jgi:hypothetical protein
MRVRFALVVLLLAVPPAHACDLIYPEGYVAPTSEELISQSEAAFVGHVVGYRIDDGTIIEHDINCSGFEGPDNCWELRQTIVTAILAVDVDIRGMNGQALFEDDRSADSGADCGNDYAQDTVYLVTGFGPTLLAALPDQTTVAAWRALPLVGIAR